MFQIQIKLSDMRVGARKSIPTSKLEYVHLMAYQRIENVRRRVKETEQTRKRKQKERAKTAAKNKKDNKSKLHMKKSK